MLLIFFDALIDEVFFGIALAPEFGSYWHIPSQMVKIHDLSGQRPTFKLAIYF